MAQAGEADPGLLQAAIAGVPVAKLVKDGANIATGRLVGDGVRIYGEALGFFARANEARRGKVRGASAAFVGVAVHHLDALRHRAEEMAATKRREAAARARAKADQEAAVAEGATLHNQARKALRHAAKSAALIARADAAAGVTVPPSKLADGLSAMAKLLEEWLASRDAALIARLKLAHLDAAYAAELSAAALAVRRTVAAGSKRTSPKAAQAELDREEGVQIALLKQIVRAFEAAHERDRTIPRLQPIATRRLFNHHGPRRAPTGPRNTRRTAQSPPAVAPSPPKIAPSPPRVAPSPG